MLKAILAVLLIIIMAIWVAIKFTFWIILGVIVTIIWLIFGASL